MARAKSSRAVPVAIGVVFLVAGFVKLARPWSVVGDFAVAELIVRHAGRHLPLSGPYSAQRGYNHPLPWFYAVEWLPYHLFGSRSSAAPATALWWNGACAAALVGLLARRGAVALGVIAFGALLILASSIEGVVLVQPWNPNFAIVPAFGLIFVSWRVAIGEARLLPLSAGLAVWCVGAHLGFLPLVVALLGTSWISLLVARVVDRRGVRALLRPLLIALATGGVLLLPALIDIVLHGSASNPARILDWARPGSQRATVPASQAFKVLRGELSIPPAWTRGTPPYDVLLYRPTVRPPLLLAVAAIVAIAAWRRRARDELVGIAVGLVGLGAATVGLTQIDGSMLAPWYLLPAHIAGAALAAFVAWSGVCSIAELVRTRWPRSTGITARSERAAIVARLVPALVCGLAATLAVSQWQSPPFHRTIAATTRQLADRVEQRFAKGTRLVVDGPVQFDGYFSQSLTLQLDRAGYDVRVPDRDLFMYTKALAAPEGRPATTLLITISGSTPTSPESGARLVGTAVVPPRLTFAGRTLSVWERARGGIARAVGVEVRPRISGPGLLNTTQPTGGP